MDIAAALEITGGLSRTSKMPCFSYNLPAKDCGIGSKLRPVKNSVCSKCYAMKGFYVFKNVKNALEKRLNSITHPLWVEAMTLLIETKEKSGYFRFHDSGDIQSEAHLDKICQIAKNLKNIKFWLPTREFAIVSNYIKNGNKIPSNLIIRFSAYMIDGLIPTKLANSLGVYTSSVSKTNQETCPSGKQNNTCDSCRRCWDKKVANVVYKAH
jgi:hypothetical protein